MAKSLDNGRRASLPEQEEPKNIYFKDVRNYIALISTKQRSKHV